MDDIFSYDTPAGKKHADAFLVLTRLREFTNNRLDEMMNEAHYLAQIASSPTLEDGSPNDDYVRHDPAQPDSAQKISKARQSQDDLVRAVIYAFDFVPFDRETGQGATYSFCIGALNAFVAFASGVKKNTGLSVT